MQVIDKTTLDEIDQELRKVTEAVTLLHKLHKDAAGWEITDPHSSTKIGDVSGKVASLVSGSRLLHLINWTLQWPVLSSHREISEAVQQKQAEDARIELERIQKVQREAEERAHAERIAELLVKHEGQNTPYMERLRALIGQKKRRIAP